MLGWYGDFCQCRSRLKSPKCSWNAKENKAQRLKKFKEVKPKLQPETVKFQKQEV